MTALGLFNQNLRASDIDAVQNAAHDLPAEFSEAFDTSWRAMTEWHSSVGYSTARSRALIDYHDDVQRRTGAALPLPDLAVAGGMTLDDVNAAQAKLAEQHPDAGLTPLTEERLHAMALARMAKAHDDSAAFGRRETTWGGSAGTVAATLLGGLTDPVTLATLPFGGFGEAGIVLRGLEFAAIGGGTEAASAALNYKTREAAVPGASKEIPGEIASATAFGGALGLAFGTLGKLAARGAHPLPTAVRDDLNVATSEAQLGAVNPFGTAAGETAARDAHVSAIEQLLHDAPVTAGSDFSPAHVSDLARELKAGTPDELAAAAETRLRPETIGERPDPQRFDPQPSAEDDAFSYWDKRLQSATPEERASLGATDADLAAAAGRNAADGAPAVAARDLSPAEVAKLDADPGVPAAALHDLDHIAAANPDAEFTMATRLDDGTYRLDSRKLSDVLAEIDATDTAGRELLACATGMLAAAE